MCDPLRKNLLLPSWFVEDFEEESFASSLEIFFFFFWYWTHWGRIFYFLIGDTLGKNFQLPYWGYFGEELSTSLLGIALTCLGPSGKNLLPPSWV